MTTGATWGWAREIEISNPPRRMVMVGKYAITGQFTPLLSCTIPLSKLNARSALVHNPN